MSTTYTIDYSVTVACGSSSPTTIPDNVTIPTAMPATVLLSIGHISLSEAATSGVGSQLQNMLYFGENTQEIL